MLTYITEKGDENASYSTCVVFRNMIYLSGIVSENIETGQSLHGDIGFETRNAMMRVKSLLEKHGSGMNKVIKVDVFLTDISEIGEMNAVYKTFFPVDKKPARCVVQISKLHDGLKIEITVTAVI